MHSRKTNVVWWTTLLSLAIFFGWVAIKAHQLNAHGGAIAAIVVFGVFLAAPLLADWVAYGLARSPIDHNNQN